jgi:hypothetical protein
MGRGVEEVQEDGSDDIETSPACGGQLQLPEDDWSSTLSLPVGPWTFTACANCVCGAWHALDRV